ncbi:hypothetical protein DFJ43DRAFT_1228052 [Lentinula guzmanii]|uniref:Uncharacterized protein n=1 Tax=Lentinula guzmanii TaxID=2804957 RepID=A0AA38MUY8_9AGAR|nr:hypothetical protein DFJ43DRAFT_1228052 [Lentinula guzmanii]
MVIYPLSSLRLIIILLFSTSAILDVMSIPLAGRADASSSSRRKKPSTTRDPMRLFLVRTRKSGQDTRRLEPNEADEFADDWSIYFGYASGFTVVCDNANVPVASPNWPWKVSPLKREYDTSGTFTSIAETLAEISHGIWRSKAINIKDHLEKNLPVEGRFSYLDAVMQYLWAREIITEADIGKWNTRVQAMLNIERSEEYVTKMKEIKYDTVEGQQLKLQEEEQGQCPNFDFNHFLNLDHHESG